MATKRTKPGSEDRAAISQMVLDGMRSGLSAFKACQKAGVSQSTFNDWLNADVKLAAEYAHAREDLIERMANEIMDLADSEVPETGDGKKDWQAIQKHKLQVDTRKWLLSKLSPKKYGDKLEVSGDPTNPLVTRIERVVVKV
jgi:DNA-binding transcriptional regulator YdaS (Cro superfamily)